MAYKRYRSLFSEKRLSGQSKFKVQEKLRRILREKALSGKDIDSIVGKIEAVITEVISGYGVDNTIVDELSNTVKNINSYGSSIAAQNVSINQTMDMEETFKRKQRKIRENMFGMGMDATSDMYMDDQMYASDIDTYDDYDEFGNEVINADPISVDEFGFEMDDVEGGLYENRRGKIKKLSRKLREGEESDDFITDSEDLTDEEVEYDEEGEEKEPVDEDEMEMDEDDDSEEKEPVDEMEMEMDEDDDEDADDEVKVKTDESFYFEDESEEGEGDDEEAEKEAKKEHFRRNRLRRESRSSIRKRPMRQASYREESESEDGDDMIPMDNGSDYDFLDGIDDMGNASSERSMNAKYDSRKRM